MSLVNKMLVVALTLGLAGPAFGQQQKGDVEVQFQGSFFTTVGGDVSNSVGTISGKIGPFVTANIQIGIGPTLTISTNATTSIDQGTGATITKTTTKATVGTTAFVVYSLLLHDARTVPYLGASYYKRDFSNGSDRGWIGGNGGAKFYFTKRTAADLSVNYLFSLNAETKGGMLLFAVGLSFLL
jgi:hypothetical protein